MAKYNHYSLAWRKIDRAWSLLIDARERLSKAAEDQATQDLISICDHLGQTLGAVCSLIQDKAEREKRGEK
jgi:hypothetical protein